MHGFRHKEVWDACGIFCIFEQVNVVTFDWGVQRSAELLPVGEEFVERTRFENRTGENVGADFGTFLDHTNADFLASVSGLLFQSACGGKTGGAGADDDDVEFHVFAFHSLSPTRGSSIFYDVG